MASLVTLPLHVIGSIVHGINQINAHTIEQVGNSMKGQANHKNYLASATSSKYTRAGSTFSTVTVQGKGLGHTTFDT